MTRIIAVANQKGGVGKTTTAVNLAASLAATRRRVLLVDMDPQGNATMSSGVDKHHIPAGTYELLMGEQDFTQVVTESPEGGYHLVPANGDLTAAEVHLLDRPDRERRLRLALAPHRDRYHYILIDCPPALNMLTINALVAAHGVLIPMQCEYFALEGLSALLETIDTIRRSHNPELSIQGLLRTMYDPRNNLTNEVSEQLKAYFRDKLYRTVIPRNIRLAEAPSHGKPVLAYDRTSRGAQGYLALAGELLRREEEGSEALS